jgi:hypothetical protein
MDIVEAAKPPDNRPKGARYSPPPTECAEAKAVMCYDRSDEIEDKFRDLQTCLLENRISTAKGIVAFEVEQFDEIERQFAEAGRQKARA